MNVLSSLTKHSQLLLKLVSDVFPNVPLKHSITMNSVTGVICKHSHASITMNSQTGVICKYTVMQVSLKHSNTMNSQTHRKANTLQFIICKYNLKRTAS